MATYYVRKTGNDGNTGLSPAQAWLTIDHAANNVAAGDTVWIGSGVYRELVTMDTSGTSGNQISYIGDIDGVETGDPGPVIISAYDVQTGPVLRTYCVDMNEQTFITWQYVIMDGGSTACYGDFGATAHWAMEGDELLDCVLLTSTPNDFALDVDLNQGATPTADGFQMKRCTILGSVIFRHDNQATAHLNLKMNIENNLHLPVHASSNNAFNFYCTANNTYSIGGVDIVNCTIIGFANGVNGGYFKDTTNKLRVLNCRMFGVGTGTRELGSTVNAVYEDYNHLCGSTQTKTANVQAGGNSSVGTAGLVVGGIADLMFYNKLGWSPWKPWEPMMLLDQAFKEPSIDAGSAAYAPADDVFGNPRPMGRSGADDVGIVEARTRAEEETVAADAVAAFKGAGYHDMMAAVDAAETTFTVTGRYDSNYAGNLPIFRVLEIPGVADQSDVMTAAADTDETLSITFTPTSAGYVRLRLESRDTSANGEAYFKDLASA